MGKRKIKAGEIEMIKTKNEILNLALNSYAKLKQNVLGIAGAIFFLSTLVTDVVNVRAGTDQNVILLLAENIHLIFPWGLAYLIFLRHRNLFKIFTPLYLSLVLLASTISLGFNSHSLQAKFKKEMGSIMKDFANSIDDIESSSVNLSSTYSADEYGFFAAYLNNVKKSTESSKREAKIVQQAINEVELDKVFTDEVLFNLLNIVEKKKKLERFLLLLDESAKRTENIYSELVNWVFSSPDIAESSRKNLAKAILISFEDNRYMRQEPYRIKKNIAQEYIKLLDFLSKIYGTYVKDADDQIICSNENDIQILRSYIETLSKLFKEEESFAILCSEKAKHVRDLYAP